MSATATAPQDTSSITFLGQARICKPPSPLPALSDVHGPSVFLAGSIEMDKATRWQAALETQLQSHKVTVYNPRRDVWNGSLEQRAHNAEFSLQVNWELDALDRADVIAMYLEPGTNSPISLLELGLYATSGRLVVCCPENFYRRGNVEIVCERYGVTLVNDLDTFLKVVVDKLEPKLPADAAQVAIAST